MKELFITISGAPVTKKNSQRMVTLKTKNGKSRTIPMPSEAYKKYEQAAQEQLPKITPIETPCNVQVVYYMPTRRVVDLCNLLSATCDILVRYHIIADDNCSIVVSHDGSAVYYDKDNPRAEITITERSGTFVRAE